MTFVKGQSGNPGGRPKGDTELKKIFEAASGKAAQTVIDLLQSDDDGIRLKASQYIHDRLYGKPKQQTEISNPEGEAFRIAGTPKIKALEVQEWLKLFKKST